MEKIIMTFEEAKKIARELLERLTAENHSKKEFKELSSGWPRGFRALDDVYSDFIEIDNQTYAVAGKQEGENKMRQDSSILADLLLLESPLGVDEFQKRRAKLQELMRKDEDLGGYFDSKEKFTSTLSNKIDLEGFLKGKSMFDIKDLNLVKRPRIKKKSFGSKFWRFICLLVLITILPSTILQLMKLTDLIQNSTDDYQLGVTTGSLTVNIVIIGLTIWFFVKLKKKT